MLAMFAMITASANDSIWVQPSRCYFNKGTYYKRPYKNKKKPYKNNNYLLNDSCCDYTSLAYSITKNCKNDYEKVSAIYEWICDNISYDASCEIYDADLCYKYKKGVCLAYCNLFYYIAKAVGVRVEIVSGKTKDRCGNIVGGGHTWIFAYVDGNKGILLDPTWGAGGVNDENEFVKSDDCWDWFDVNPKWMILTHYPTDPKYQFLKKKVTFDMFKALPVIYPEWIRIGFPTSYIYDYCIENMNNKHPDLPLILRGCEGKYEIVSVPMTNELQKGETYTFKIRPKVDSDWIIKDGCGEHRDWDISSDGVYTMELTINCTGRVIIFVKKENGRSYRGCICYIVK